MAKGKSRELTEADLEQARKRALDAPPLPDDVRRQLVLLLKRQDELPTDYRSLIAWIPSPSGWVITHLMPLLSSKLSTTLRSERNEASLIVAERIEKVGSIVANDPAGAVRILVEPLPKGIGSRKAGNVQLSLLRILDLGILGLPVVCAIYARFLGVLDTSTVLISEANLSVEESLISAEKLDGKKTWTVSKGDMDTKHNGKIYYELIPPDYFNSVPIG